MRLNVEISAKADYWNDDKLRRQMKIALSQAVNDVIIDREGAELHRLQFIVPKAKTRKDAS